MVKKIQLILLVPALVIITETSCCVKSEATLEAEQQAPATETNTTSNKNLIPIVPNPITVQEAKEIILSYVYETTGIPIEQLRIVDDQGLAIDENNVKPLVIDPLYGEQVYHFIVVDERSFHGEISEESLTLKLIVDSHGNVMDYREYEKIVNERNKAIAGNIDPQLFGILQKTDPDEIISVKISATSENYIKIADFIKSNGYTVREDYVIYADLPVSFILSLAHCEDFGRISIHQNLPTALP